MSFKPCPLITPQTPAYRALRFSGTLLPLPALYFFVPPIKSLGFGNADSSLKFHLASLTTKRSGPEPLEGEVRVGLGDLAPLAVRVKADGSSIDWRRDEPLDLSWTGGSGEGAEGAEGVDDGGGGGGGGGAELGEACPAARMVACATKEGVEWDAGGGGGGGGCDRGAGERLGRGGADDGGGGGGAAGAAAEDGGGGGGGVGAEGAGADGAKDMDDGFRDVGKGGGFLPIGGGGPLDPIGVVFLRFATPPGGGSGGRPPGIVGAAPGGGLGAEKAGGFGAELVGSPGSERYVESVFAPVSMPPLFFSLGIPPAKSPAN